jgi:hypothetical protein
MIGRMSRCLGAAIVACGAATGTASAQWLNYRMADVPRLPDGKPNLSAAVPKTANGRPDLSGIWAAECAVYGRDGCFTRSLFFDLTKDLKPGDVEMTPWAAAIQAQRQDRNHVDDPYGYCLPPGVPRIDFAGGPFKILQTPTVTALLYESLVGMIFRQVFTDGRPLPPAGEPTWLGYSVGRWEGDALFVETSGFRDGGWLDTLKGHPHSDALRVTERFRRQDFGHMDLTVTITDPKAYLRPWSFTAALTLLPDTDLIEAFCDGHDKTMEHRRVTPAPEAPSPRN